MSYNTASPRMKRGISGRGGPGGRARGKPNINSPPSQTLEGLYGNDRIVSAVTSVVGCTANVTGLGGKQFEGVFKTISPEASLVLGKANQVEEPRQNGVVDGIVQKADIIEQLVIHHKDWTKVEFKDVNLEDCYYYYSRRGDGFKTDNAISGNKRVNGQMQKPLEKWEPGDTGEPLESATLEGHRNMENGWSATEMFEMNEKKYGVKSTYNEDMEEYTTKLDKVDTPEYRERERFAAQKAEEISKESPYERNAFDAGRTEEQLYSAVVRNKHVDRSSTPNWRQHHSDRPPERDQRMTRLSQEGSGSPVPVRKEPVRSQTKQNDETTDTQVKEKIDKPVTVTPVECTPEQKVEACSEVVKAEPKSVQNVDEDKPSATPDKPSATLDKPSVTLVSTTITTAVNTTVTPANTPVTPANTPVTPTTQQSTKTTQEASNTPEVATQKTKNGEIEELKEFGVNFKLKEKSKSEKKGKVKKIEEEVKTHNETTSKEEKSDAQTQHDVKTDADSADTKAKYELNPNAQEFRPRGKRNTPSPRSNSTPSSSGAASPFQNSSFPTPNYPPNNIYQRNGPRGRGLRQEYMDTPGFINASAATGQPFFAPHMPPQFIPHSTPPGMNLIPHGSLRHPGMQHFLLQQHPPQPMMVPVGQMTPGHYPDNTIYYGPAMPTMIQSPPQQITSPSLQQSQFTFPPISTVRPAAQPPVIPQQPGGSVVYVRTPEIPPTQIMTNRPPGPQSFQGN